MGLSQMTCSDQPTVPHSLQYVRLVLAGPQLYWHSVPSGLRISASVVTTLKTVAN